MNKHEFENRDKSYKKMLQFWTTSNPTQRTEVILWNLLQSKNLQDATFLEEIKPVVMESYEFECTDTSKPTAFLSLLDY